MLNHVGTSRQVAGGQVMDNMEQVSGEQEHRNMRTVKRRVGPDKRTQAWGPLQSGSNDKVTA